jgi:hypothetical protein
LAGWRIDRRVVAHIRDEYSFGRVHLLPEARANLYRDVLQVHVADLEATLAGLTTSVESLLNQRAA